MMKPEIRTWMIAPSMRERLDHSPAGDGCPRFDRHQAVDFAFSPVELDERTRRVVVGVLEELVERGADLAVDAGWLTDEPKPEVAAARDRRLVETERILEVAGQTFGAKPVRAGSIVDQAHHATPVQ